MDSLHVGLIKGRHPLPVDGYVWSSMVEDPLDFDTLESEAQNWIADVVKYDLDNQIINNIYLYVTGLTPCTISFLKAWEQKGYTLADNLVLMHHDRETDNYVEQQWKF